MRPRTDQLRCFVLMMVAGLSLGLSACGRASTTDLIGQAHSADSSDRARAVKALGERPKEADKVVPVLIELLKDEDAFVRRDAALALGQLGPKAQSAATALRAATRDRNAHVRRAAAEAVRKVEPT